MILEFSEKGIVFFPDPDLVGTPADYGLEFEEVWFPAADGVRLHGWWVPRATAPVLLWFHGNAGNISHRLENLKLLHDLAEVQVFIFDYREYGKSEGRISREGTFKDAAAAYRYVAADRQVPTGEIVLFGRSLGSALATDLAVRAPCRSLILESAFTNSSEMAKLFAPFMFDWRPSVPYDNLGKIAKRRSAAAHHPRRRRRDHPGGHGPAPVRRGKGPQGTLYHCRGAPQRHLSGGWPGLF